jgi:hypothetical protein
MIVVKFARPDIVALLILAVLDTVIVGVEIDVVTSMIGQLKY